VTHINRRFRSSSRLCSEWIKLVYRTRLRH